MIHSLFALFAVLVQQPAPHFESEASIRLPRFSSLIASRSRLYAISQFPNENLMLPVRVLDWDGKRTSESTMSPAVTVIGANDTDLICVADLPVRTVGSEGQSDLAFLQMTGGSVLNLSIDKVSLEIAGGRTVLITDRLGYYDMVGLSVDGHTVFSVKEEPFEKIQRHVINPTNGSIRSSTIEVTSSDRYRMAETFRDMCVMGANELAVVLRMRTDAEESAGYLEKWKPCLAHVLIEGSRAYVSKIVDLPEPEKSGNYPTRLYSVASADGKRIAILWEEKLLIFRKTG